MLFRSWTRAVHDPTGLLKDVFADNLSEIELVAMTECLSHIADQELALSAIRNQLENSRPLVREAALVALRVISVKEPGRLYSSMMREAIFAMSQADESPTLRLLAAEALRDYQFEKPVITEYKRQMENTVEIQGTYGGDETHALSAWTSTVREMTEEKRGRMDKLLTMLATSGHETPFEKSALHFLVTTDIATHIHLLKHRIGVSINGESARYKELKDDKFYVPVDWDVDEQNEYIAFMEDALQKYHACIVRLKAKGVPAKRAKESARFYLPYGNQITADIMFNWRSFAHFVRLRYSMHAQLEVRQVAQKMLQLVLETGNFNLTFDAFGLLNDDGTLALPFDQETK